GLGGEVWIRAEEREGGEGGGGLEEVAAGEGGHGEAPEGGLLVILAKWGRECGVRNEREMERRSDGGTERWCAQPAARLSTLTPALSQREREEEAAHPTRLRRRRSG